jgi:hypothetical protein
MTRPNDYGERAEANDKSRNKAKHHAEQWSADELEQLMSYWDGTEETLADIAEMLGRTIEACRQRYYLGRRGHLAVEITKAEPLTVRGWLVGFCFECGRFGDVYSDGLAARCEECR